MPVDEDEAGDLWFGTCKGCGEEWTIPDVVLREHYPEHAAAFDAEGEFLAQCSVCESDVDLTRQHVEVIPFSAWTVLPPASGCPECGRDHPIEQPHDLQSLVYQYYFRNREARAGREERWPTWADAMAHCDIEIQEGWIEALASHGIVV